jgi:hypothetical protein
MTIIVNGTMIETIGINAISKPMRYLQVVCRRLIRTGGARG